MIEPAQLAATRAPEWMAAEMPPGYRTRLLEIQRLSADLHAMDAIGQVLWGTGEPLREALARVFGELKCEVDAGAGADAGRPITVHLDESRRLLLLVSDAPGPIDKTGEGITRAFQAVQFAQDGDCVVFVAHTQAAAPPAERADAVLPDALALLERMGVVVVATATIFRLWRLSLEDPLKARKALDRLHEQDGGLFVLQPR